MVADVSRVEEEREIEREDDLDWWKWDSELEGEEEEEVGHSCQVILVMLVW